MKKFNGKAIYNPSGKAGEYSYWACNFYVGCSNGCTYCYCKKGILAGAMGGDTPKLKSCFKDENHALEVFEEELRRNKHELQQHGLFFTFTTDPFLPETEKLYSKAILTAAFNNIPVKVLTKRADFFRESSIFMLLSRAHGATMFEMNYIAFGFTLTGHDELEPNASPNAERIEAMRKLHEAGFKTWASIEPIIDLGSSLKMILDARHFCNLFKIGLESGKKYDKDLLQIFIGDIIEYTEYFGCKIYFKDTLLKQAGISRSELPNNCVGIDYNIFNS